MGSHLLHENSSTLLSPEGPPVFTVPLNRWPPVRVGGGYVCETSSKMLRSLEL